MFDVYATTHRVENNGVGIVVADHGPSDGVPVVLIHGWPDTAKLWRHQIPVLTQAGYRVLAIDVRGYGRSDKPTDISAYALHVVGSDFDALFTQLQLESAHIVGHDWGSGISWYLGLTQPHVIRSLSTLSVGHPLAFRNAGFRQLEKSWYTLLYQFEDVAETWLSADDWKNFRTFCGHHSEVENWIHDLAQPGALRSSLGLYRANLGPDRLVEPRPDLSAITAPVMGVWSTGDLALTEKQMTGSSEFVADEFRYERIEGAGHWIPLDAPDKLNDLLVDWLGAN